MKKFFILIIAGILLSLCVSCQPPKEVVEPGNPQGNESSELYPVSGAQEIIGKWSFVYFKKYLHLEGQLPAPPVFDDMEFTESDRVLLKSWAGDQELVGTYIVTFGLLHYQYQPLKAPHSIGRKVGCFLANQGKAMIIFDDQTELVYFRSNRIFENSISGSWRTEINGQEQIMILSKDGVYRIEPGAVTGNYRLWPSKLGDSMTAIYRDPTHGAFTAIFLYKLKNNTLTLTPVEEDQGNAEKAVIWRKQ
jgi:hypothetical protein